MGEGRKPRRGWWAPGLAPGANACVPSGLGVFWGTFPGAEAPGFMPAPLSGLPTVKPRYGSESLTIGSLPSLLDRDPEELVQEAGGLQHAEPRLHLVEPVVRPGAVGLDVGIARGVVIEVDRLEEVVAGLLQQLGFGIGAARFLCPCPELVGAHAVAVSLHGALALAEVIAALLELHQRFLELVQVGPL